HRPRVDRGATARAHLALGSQSFTSYACSSAPSPNLSAQPIALTFWSKSVHLPAGGRDSMELNLGSLLGATKAPSAQRLTLYIPNKDREGTLLQDHDRWVREAQALLTEIGNGATAFPPVDGTWLKPDGGVLWEQTRILY